MSNLYGGTLVIGNGFQSTFNQFANDMNRAGNQFKKFKNDNTNQANKAGRAWQDSFNGATKSFDKFFNNTTSKIAKLTAGFLTMKGAISGVQKILESGMEFQNASVFLQSAYGEKEGKNKFKFATNFANKTPFEESEVANALARSKMLGLKDNEKAFNMYSDVGSMAKITGTGDLNSAIDAISDMKNGEWMRLQTILGIKRNGLEDYAKAKGMGSFTNKKGQITNQDALMKAFESYLGEKGILGMTEKYSKTLSGRMSTLGGNFKKALAELGGIKDDGTLQEGGLFDQACKGVEKLIKSVNTFAKSSSFDKIKRALGDVGEAIIKGFDYLTTHPETVDKLLKFGKAFVEFKVIGTLIKPFKELSGALGGIPSTIKTVVSSIKALSGINMATGTAGSGMASTLGNMGGRALLTKAGSKIGGKVFAPLALGVEGFKAFSNEENILRKGINAIVNGAISPFTGGEKYDSMGWLASRTSKIANSLSYKMGRFSEDDLRIANKNQDTYLKTANDYINGRTDSYIPIMDVIKHGTGSEINSRPIQINIDKIEKDVDTDSLLLKLTNIINNKNSRNSVYA